VIRNTYSITAGQIHFHFRKYIFVGYITLPPLAVKDLGFGFCAVAVTPHPLHDTPIARIYCPQAGLALWIRAVDKFWRKGQGFLVFRQPIMKTISI